jgi:X-X-X-Leu-X-X-Gly heptad repeat protein
MQIKMGEKFGIGEMPEARAVVRHGVELSRDEKGGGVVSMEALVEGLETEEVGGSSDGGGGPFRLPRHGRGVVGATGDSAFADVKGVSGNIQLNDGSGKLQIGVSDCAGGVGKGDKGGCSVGIKTGTPQDGTLGEW